MQPRFFPTQLAFRKWLDRHHGRASEVWLGFHKAASGRRGLTYREALDVALCYGWIDGVRRSVDASRYVNRFSPRRDKSRWSAVNVRRVKELIALGAMHPAGVEAFERRTGDKAGYSFEERPRALPKEYEQRFRRSAAAWTFFTAQPPGYRRTSIFWVTSAVKEETRRRRLQTLIDDSAAGQRIGLLRPTARR